MLTSQDMWKEISDAAAASISGGAGCKDGYKFTKKECCYILAGLEIKLPKAHQCCIKVVPEGGGDGDYRSRADARGRAEGDYTKTRAGTFTGPGVSESRAKSESGSSPFEGWD